MPDTFPSQIAQLQDRIEALRDRAGHLPSALLQDALAELSVTVEELRVAEDELRLQGEELARTTVELEHDRQRYLDLFNFAPDGYLVTDPAGLILEANRAAGEMLARPPSFLVGKPVFVFLAVRAKPNLRQRLIRLAEYSAPITWEGLIRPHGLNPLEVEFTVVGSRDWRTGRLDQLRWRMSDITARKQADRELRESREALRELSARLQLVREEERTRIARQVHDELGSALTALKMQVVQARHKLADSESQAALDQAGRTADEMMDLVRRIATDLRPALLDELGLVAAVDWQLQDFEKHSGIQTQFYVSGGAACPPEVATVLFRVFQELLTNVVRHAHARHVEVRLSQPDSTITLQVQDDGNGISEAQARRVTSLGIMGIRERLEQLHGTFNIKGEGGKGTTAVVMVPLEQA